MRSPVSNNGAVSRMATRFACIESQQRKAIHVHMLAHELGSQLFICIMVISSCLKNRRCLLTPGFSGLLMNSEVWVCLTDEERCIPFVLVENGYDVWVR